MSNRGYERLSLIHKTKVENADSIIQSQEFKLGDGLYGKGVYFANTIEAAASKVHHHRGSNIRWCYLIADVYITKKYQIKKADAARQKPDIQNLKSQDILYYHWL